MRDRVIQRFKALYGHPPQALARAPGRIEFIGNHTDYNGGTVMGVAIDRATWVACRTHGTEMRFASTSRPGFVAVSEQDCAPRAGEDRWVNYPLGVWSSLEAFGLKRPSAFEYLADSDLPVGAGLSSSAAIELATALALLALGGENPPRETVVALARHAENSFVGVPCGILDQGVSGFGDRRHLVFIDCAGPRFDLVPLPAGVRFWIFNTHVKHALVDGLYAARHRECQEAAAALGVARLADVGPAQLERSRHRLSPPACRRARHVVEEIERVARTREALVRGDLTQVGLMLTASHRSSQTQFENSTPELDCLVDALTAMPHVFGARLTGGGFGGAVMALTDADFSQEHAESVVGKYAAQFGSRPDVLACEPGDGAETIVLPP